MPRVQVNQSGLSLNVDVEGIDLSDFDQLPARVARRASQAVNKTATKYRTQASRDIREQVNFTARYLVNRENGRLTIPKKASPTDLSAVIRGRDRATSLATFMVSKRRQHGTKAPWLRVSPERRTRIPKSFVMRLRGGEFGPNFGLAIRLKPGERIHNKRQMISYSKKDPYLYLLYGPSVDQVFREVAQDIAPGAGYFLESEFLRLMEADL